MSTCELPRSLPSNMTRLMTTVNASNYLGVKGEEMPQLQFLYNIVLKLGYS